MTVICETCQTPNRDKAMFCRGCAGKLPAFVATGPAPLSMQGGTVGAPPSGSGGRVYARRTRNAPPGRQDHRVRRWWFAAVLLLGATAAALVGWIALTPGRTAAGMAPPALTASAASAPPAAAAAPAAPGSGTVSFESALAPGESAVAAGPAPAATTAVATVEAAPSAEAVPAPAARPAPVRTTTQRTAGNGRADPRAGCEHLFFAFAARCEANHCAEAAYARHPRCDVVRAERQRDDARRNMTSGY